MRTGFNFSEVIENYYNSDQIKKIQSIKIGIAGAGGIGSNCAILLIRSGFWQFTIADFDRVTASNLNRQAYAAHHIGRLKTDCLREICQSINPAVSICTHPIRIDASSIHEIFDDSDIIIEAFDGAASKALLFAEFLHSGKLLIGANGIAGIGSSEKIGIRKIRENCFVVGDETSAISDKLKPFAPRVMITAAKMVDVVLERVVGSLRGEV